MWTDDRVALLRKSWIEGLSASQIAKQLGGVSRNAVIGKVHRIGLAGRATPSRPAKRPTRTARPRMFGPFRPPTLVNTQRSQTEFANALARSKELRPIVGLDGLAFSALTVPASGCCKFPIGDPSDAEFGLCGRTTISTKAPYCGDHVRLCYTASVAREKLGDAGGHGKRGRNNLLRLAAL